MGEHREKSQVTRTAVVITVSDRSARGERQDLSGPRAVSMLAAAGFEVTSNVVADGAESVENALRAAVGSGAALVITSGGTGIAPRDQTPEGTRPVLVRELPGIAEQLRREGAANNPMAVLSRGIAGVAGEPPCTLVVNLPGSVKAVEEGVTVLLPLIPHVLDQLAGGDH